MLRSSFIPLALWASRTVMLAVALAACFGALAQAGVSPGNQNLGSILFIGDSITQGGSDGDSTKTVRSCLYTLLTNAGYTFSFTGHWRANPEGLPETGDSANDDLYRYHSGVEGAVIGADTGPPEALRSGITHSLPGWWNTERLALDKPNLILIMIGTNDVDLGLKLGGARHRLITLIRTFYRLPEVGEPTILLANIPPNRRTPHRQRAVRVFNRMVPGVARLFRRTGRDVRFVDQFTALNANFETLMIDGDNLHPNGAGDEEIAKTWFDKIQALVQPAP